MENSKKNDAQSQPRQRVNRNTNQDMTGKKGKTKSGDNSKDMMKHKQGSRDESNNRNSSRSSSL